MSPDQPQHRACVLDELLDAPVIRPAAVARGKALVAAGDDFPADAVASRLVDDLVAGTPPSQ